MSLLKTHMEPCSLSKEQLKFYEENGYLLLKNIWPKEDIDILRRDVDKYANGRFTVYLHSHLDIDSCKSVHRGKKMCDIADSIYDDRGIPVGSTLFYCKPNNEKLEHGSTWHQDNYAGRSTPGSYLNIAIAIDDADESNGALMVVPGSHRLGDLPCNPKPNFARDDNGNLYCSAPIGNDCELPKDLPMVQLKYSAGDVLVVHGLLVHKAEVNKHPTLWRRTLYTVYIKNNEPFWPGWTSGRKLLDRYDSDDYR